MFRGPNQYLTDAKFMIALAVIGLGAITVAATAPVIDTAAYVISAVMSAVLTVVAYYFARRL